MPSASALWFHIGSTFSEIQALCVQARAAQLAQEQTRGAPKAPKAKGMKRTMVSTGAPDDDLDGGGREDPRLAMASTLARDLSFREENAGGPDMVGLRDQIRKRLKRLENKFAEVLSDYDRYYALFPVVVYIDELVQLGTRGEASRWEPLQGELFDEENGGETFFSILDDKLRQTETHPVVLEVFYFCLSDGFTGMFLGDPKKLEEYRVRLAERIPLKPTEPGRAEGPKSVELVSFPWAFYAVTALLIVGTHLLLTWLAAPVTP